MDESKTKNVFVVVGANFLGIPTEGITIIPAVVHQQHGDTVHCFTKIRGVGKDLLITVKEDDIFFNIKDAFDAVNKELLTPKPAVHGAFVDK